MKFEFKKNSFLRTILIALEWLDDFISLKEMTVQLHR